MTTSHKHPHLRRRIGVTHEWPFGPKHIEEQYLNADPRLLEFDEDDLASPLPAGDR